MAFNFIHSMRRCVLTGHRSRQIPWSFWSNFVVFDSFQLQTDTHKTVGKSTSPGKFYCSRSDILFYLLVVTLSSPPHHFLWNRWTSNTKGSCCTGKVYFLKKSVSLFSACMINNKRRKQLSSKCSTLSFINAPFSGIRGWWWGYAGYILASETDMSRVMFLCIIMSFGSWLQSSRCAQQQHWDLCRKDMETTNMSGNYARSVN